MNHVNQNIFHAEWFIMCCSFLITMVGWSGLEVLLNRQSLAPRMSRVGHGHDVLSDISTLLVGQIGVKQGGREKSFCGFDELVHFSPKVYLHFKLRLGDVSDDTPEFIEGFRTNLRSGPTVPSEGF